MPMVLRNALTTLWGFKAENTTLQATINNIQCCGGHSEIVALGYVSRVR